MDFEYLPSNTNYVDHGDKITRFIDHETIVNPVIVNVPSINSVSLTQPIVIDSEIISTSIPNPSSNINISNDNELPSTSILPICDLNGVQSHSLYSTPEKFSIVSSNPEYKEVTQIVNGGRKRSKINKRKEFQLKKNHINAEWSFTLNNSCSHFNEKKKNVCNVSHLLEEDVMSFRKSLSHIPLKIDQDKFILTMMVIKSPDRTDRRKTIRKERNAITYYIPKKSGERIRVCVTAFSNISSFTSRRIIILANKFHDGITSPKEVRGGSRITAKDEEISDAIIKFIQKF